MSIAGCGEILMSPRISRTNRATWSARQCAPVVWIVALVGCLLVPLAHRSPSADTAATTSPAAAGAEFPLLPAQSEVAFRLGPAAGAFCCAIGITACYAYSR